MTDKVNTKTLAEWLSWIEACHPSEIELGLDRVKTVADRLELNLSRSTVVTVAGTNGKGSTISYLDSIYRKAGYRVGCYTSPHFLRYNERVKLNGEEVSDQQLCDTFEKINHARGDIPLTYFEYGTLAALVIFSEETPDLVLLEVGLGGRLDAVNIVDADVSVVTTVALDHTDWLGDDREQIGFEKAGIFRAGKPAICGDLTPPKSVANHAQQLGAKLYQSGEEFSYSETDIDWCWHGVSSTGEELNIESISLPQLPLQNAATVLQTIQFIPLELSISDIKDGIESARLTGRMQQLVSGGVNYFLDVAHNPEAAEHLTKSVQSLTSSPWLVLGMLADKDIASVAGQLEPLFDKVLLVTLDQPRGQTAEQLQSHFNTATETSLYDSVADALNFIKTTNNAPENVIIAGSFFTVADALSVLESEQP